MGAGTSSRHHLGACRSVPANISKSRAFCASLGRTQHKPIQRAVPRVCGRYPFGGYGARRSYDYLRRSGRIALNCNVIYTKYANRQSKLHCSVPFRSSPSAKTLAISPAGSSPPISPGHRCQRTHQLRPPHLRCPVKSFE